MKQFAKLLKVFKLLLKDLQVVHLGKFLKKVPDTLLSYLLMFKNSYLQRVWDSKGSSEYRKMTQILLKSKYVSKRLNNVNPDR